MTRGAFSTAIKVGVSALLLYLLFRNIDARAFWKTLSSVDPRAVLAAAIIFLCTQLISTYRWSVILKKDISITYPGLLSIYFIGMFFNNFLPTAVGGDLVKGYYLYKRSGKAGVSAASIFMDRYSGLTALMLMGALALVFGYRLLGGTSLAPLLALVLAGYAGASLVLWVGRLHGWFVRALGKLHFYGLNKKVDTLYHAVMSYKSRPYILARAFLYSFAVQGGVVFGYYVLARGFGIDVSLGYYFLFIPLTTLVSMIPVPLAGLGIREGAFVYLFTRAGATQEEALTLSLTWFAVLVAVSLLGGVEYIRTGRVLAEGLKTGQGADEDASEERRRTQ